MDDRLRALERDARREPLDPEAVRAHVRALEQVGDDVGAWRERCRLARAGDRAVWDELRERRAGVRERRDVRSRELAGPRLIADSIGPVVLLEGAGGVEALGVADLETRWREPRGQAVAATGPFAVIASMSELIVRDVDGAQRGLADTGLLGTPIEVSVAADLALVSHRVMGSQWLCSADGPQVLDRWAGRSRLAGVHVLRQDVPLTRTVCHGPLGHRLWQVDGLARWADERDAIFDMFHTDAMVDVATGSPRWSGLIGDCFAVTPDLVVSARSAPLPTAGPEVEVHALDRGTGVTRWQVDVPVSPRGSERLTLHAADDMIYLLTSGREVVDLIPLEAATGRSPWARRLPAGAASLAVGDGVVVVASADQAVTIIESIR
jgi:hypothetical protein